MALGLGSTARECNASGIELSSNFSARSSPCAPPNSSWVFLNKEEEISLQCGVRGRLAKLRQPISPFLQIDNVLDAFFQLHEFSRKAEAISIKAGVRVARHRF